MPGVLPQGVLRNVFSYLDAKDTARASQVCRDWKQATDTEERACRDVFIRAYPGVRVDPRVSYKASLERQIAQAREPRPVKELDSLLAMHNRALSAADTAQGLNDLVDGLVVGALTSIHAMVSFVRAYVLTWTEAAHRGAERGRARVCRPDSTRGGQRVFEHLSGTVLGAATTLATAPVSAVLMGTQAGIDTLRDDFTYAGTRIPRGAYTYARLKLLLEDIDATKRNLLTDGDALVLERAASANPREVL